MVVERFAVLPEVEVRFCEVDEVEVLRDGVVVVLRDTAVEVRDCEVEAAEVRLCDVDEVEVLRDGVVIVAERFAELLDVEVRDCEVEEVEVRDCEVEEVEVRDCEVDEVRDCEDDEVRDWASSIGAEAVIAIATRDAVISVVIFFMV